MTNSTSGIVTNGVVIPSTPLPEGAYVEIHVTSSLPEVPATAVRHLTPSELRKMSREQRQAVFAKTAAMAEQEYMHNKELTGFEAFSEEQLDDDEPGPS
jgi:hypothetical protein